MIDEISEVTLLKKEINKDIPITNQGEPNIKQSSNVVYAERMSITQSEYYSARTKGFKPDLCLKIHAFEYSGERFCVVDNTEYEIYRTYQKSDSEFIELYLELCTKARR